jgi:hypothetical protein
MRFCFPFSLFRPSLTVFFRRAHWHSLALLSCSLLVAGAVHGEDLPEFGLVSADAEHIEGEILDFALDACRRGEVRRAMALFKAIREQLDPPQRLLDVIIGYERSGCLVPDRLLDSWGMQLGVGWDSNVSQGISARSMTLGSGLNAVELELGDVYQPKPSAYSVLGMDRRFKLGTHGIAQVAFQHRDNPSVPALDVTNLAATAAFPFIWGDRPGRVQAEVSQAWLGGSHYQQATSAVVQWLLNGGTQPWIFNFATTRSTYFAQPSQDAQQTEVGIWREKQIDPTWGVFGGVSAHFDQARNLRPGGSRSGWHYQLGATVGWSEWKIQPRLSVLRWHSSDVFSPGLIDVVRMHNLTQLALQMSRPVSQGQKVVIDWRIRNARDTVPLFSYQGQSLAVYWQFQR